MDDYSEDFEESPYASDFEDDSTRQPSKSRSVASDVLSEGKLKIPLKSRQGSAGGTSGLSNALTPLSRPLSPGPDLSMLQSKLSMLASEQSTHPGGSLAPSRTSQADPFTLDFSTSLAKKLSVVAMEQSHTTPPQPENEKSRDREASEYSAYSDNFESFAKDDTNYSENFDSFVGGDSPKGTKSEKSNLKTLQEMEESVDGNATGPMDVINFNAPLESEQSLDGTGLGSMDSRNLAGQRKREESMNDTGLGSMNITNLTRQIEREESVNGTGLGSMDITNLARQIEREESVNGTGLGSMDLTNLALANQEQREAPVWETSMGSVESVNGTGVGMVDASKLLSQDAILSGDQRKSFLEMSNDLETKRILADSQDSNLEGQLKKKSPEIPKLAIPNNEDTAPEAFGLDLRHDKFEGAKEPYLDAPDGFELVSPKLMERDQSQSQREKMANLIRKYPLEELKAKVDTARSSLTANTLIPADVEDNARSTNQETMKKVLELEKASEESRKTSENDSSDQSFAEKGRLGTFRSMLFQPDPPELLASIKENSPANGNGTHPDVYFKKPESRCFPPPPPKYLASIDKTLETKPGNSINISRLSVFDAATVRKTLSLNEKLYKPSNKTKNLRENQIQSIAIRCSLKHLLDEQNKEKTGAKEENKQSGHGQTLRCSMIPNRNDIEHKESIHKGNNSIKTRKQVLLKDSASSDIKNILNENARLNSTLNIQDVPHRKQLHPYCKKGIGKTQPEKQLSFEAVHMNKNVKASPSQPEALFSRLYLSVMHAISEISFGDNSGNDNNVLSTAYQMDKQEEFQMKSAIISSLTEMLTHPKISAAVGRAACKKYSQLQGYSKP